LVRHCSTRLQLESGSKLSPCNHSSLQLCPAGTLGSGCSLLLPPCKARPGCYSRLPRATVRHWLHVAPRASSTPCRVASRALAPSTRPANVFALRGRLGMRLPPLRPPRPSRGSPCCAASLPSRIASGGRTAAPPSRRSNPISFPTGRARASSHRFAPSLQRKGTEA